MNVSDVQRLLAAAGYYKGAIEGDEGTKTLAAIDKLLSARATECTSDPSKWSATRRRVGAGQLVLKHAGFEPGSIDGYAGHNTKEALAAWDYFRLHGKREVLPGRDEAAQAAPAAPPTTKPLAGWGPWPRQKDCANFYGDAGSAACTAGTVTLPVPHRIAWNLSQKITTFRCHTKVAAAFTSIHAETVRHYGATKYSALRLDVWGGCYNFRKMRGGSALSMHAFGIAEDLDPERNQLRWTHTKASFAKPEYAAFFNIVEAHGAVSLGRARDYDWMHIQFARL